MGVCQGVEQIDLNHILSQPFFRSIDINALLGRIHMLESKLFKDWEFRATMKLVRNELDKSSKTEMAILGANFAVCRSLSGVPVPNANPRSR